MYLVVDRKIRPAKSEAWKNRRLELGDAGDKECLAREIAEEFGKETLNYLEIQENIGSFNRKCEFDECDSVTHHFYCCRWKKNKDPMPSIHQNEVKKGRFFSLKEVEELEKQNNFGLGCEPDLIRRAVH